MLDRFIDYVSQPMELNAKTILIFIAFIVIAISLLLVSFKSFSACCRCSKRKRYAFIHIGHIICYGLVVAYFALKEQFADELHLDKIPKAVIIIVAIILVAAPTIMNIIKCGVFYGIQYSVWQMIFSLIFCSLVYAIVGIVILLIVMLFIGSDKSGYGDGSKIWIYSYNKSSFPIRMVSQTQAIDDEGNYYYYNGENYYSSSGEVYYRA